MAVMCLLNIIDNTDPSELTYTKIWSNFISPLYEDTEDIYKREKKVNKAFKEAGIVKYPIDGTVEFKNKEKMVEFLLRFG